MAVTAYDEKVNKGTMQLHRVWMATFLGACIGHLFSNDQTGKYIGAGIGAVLSTAYEAQRGLERRVTPSKTKEEALKDVQAWHQKHAEQLIKHYSS